MAQINPRTFADAKQLADNVYELILTNWGNVGPTTQDPNNGSISYPPVKSLPTGAIPILPVTGDFLLPPIPSLAAIAIAPRSTIDRCIINYTTLPQTPPELRVDPFTSVLFPCTIEQGFINKGGVLETEQILSNDSPLIGQQPGPMVIRAHNFCWFNNRYVPLPDSDPTETSFGPSMTTGGAVTGGPWVTPELRLLLYLTGNAALPPTRRAPYHLDFVASPTFPGAGLDDLLKVVPIGGRRRVRVTCRAVGANPDRTFRITGMFQLQTANVNGPPPAQPNFAFYDMYEVELAAAVTIAADESHVFEIDQPGVPFLAIRGRSGFINSFTPISIDAWD